MNAELQGLQGVVNSKASGNNMRNQLYGQEVIQQNKFYIFYYHSFQNLALPKYKNYKLINNNNFALNHPPPKNKETRKNKKELLSLFTINQVLQFSTYLCVIPTGQNSSMISGTCKGWPWKVLTCGSVYRYTTLAPPLLLQILWCWDLVHISKLMVLSQLSAT